MNNLDTTNTMFDQLQALTPEQQGRVTALIQAMAAGNDADVIVWRKCEDELPKIDGKKRGCFVKTDRDEITTTRWIDSSIGDPNDSDFGYFDDEHIDGDTPWNIKAWAYLPVQEPQAVGE